MFIRYHSDLHLEAFSGTSIERLIDKFVPPNHNDEKAVLVLAGDVSSNIEQLIAFIDGLQNRFKKVLYVPGNHEVYKHHLETWNGIINQRMSLELQNTEFVDASSVKSVIIEDCRFILGTLWGDGGASFNDRYIVASFLNDFRLVRCGQDRKFMVQDMIDMYNESKVKIKELLKSQFSGHTIVVSHHMPSRRLVAKRFWPQDGSDGANGGFVGACDDILEASNAPDVWIHGHTHCRVDEMLYNTRVLCNPTGYRGEWGLDDIGGKIEFFDTDSLN